MRTPRAGASQQQKLLKDIAVTLGVDCNTVTAAIRYWHESHGLPVPDARKRRKTLKVKTTPKSDRPDLKRQDDPSEDQAQSSQGHSTA